MFATLFTLIDDEFQVEGPATGSYGLNVAKMAGLDGDILTMAKEKAEWMLKMTIDKTVS